jgi:hypothetical protein
MTNWITLFCLRHRLADDATPAFAVSNLMNPPGDIGNEAGFIANVPADKAFGEP